MPVLVLLLTNAASKPLSSVVLTARVTVHVSYVTYMLRCFSCYCDTELKTPESKGRWITRQTEMETICGEDGACFVMAGSIRNALLAISQSPSVSNLEAVKRLLAWSSFNP
jgi:hypothetical protein